MAADEHRPQTSLWSVTVDARDPTRLAAFWSTLLRTPVIEGKADRPGWLRLQPHAPDVPFLTFQPVDEPTPRATTVHLDVLTSDLDASIDEVVGAGGSDTGARESLPRGRIAVMRDPEGNVFCLLAAPDAGGGAS